LSQNGRSHSNVNVDKDLQDTEWKLQAAIASSILASNASLRNVDSHAIERQLVPWAEAIVQMDTLTVTTCRNATARMMSETDRIILESLKEFIRGKTPRRLADCRAACR
jgi:hypothetical protein